LEYIVIDGGSTDGSAEIIRRYESHLHYWVSEKDDGQCHAINKGFIKASGEIWSWVNSDDMLAEGALAKVATVLQGKACAMVVGSAVEGELLDIAQGRLDRRKPSRSDLEYRARTFPQPSVFWTRDLAERSLLNGSLLDPALHLALDLDLWLRMNPHINELIFLEDVLSYERLHPAQKTALRTYSPEQYIRERDYACLRASILRRRLPVRWWFAAWLHHLASDLHIRNYRSLGRATLVARTFRPALRHSLQVLVHGRSFALERLRAEQLA
jgi:glycosyltransferase involved in cell wall biosynthesis